MMEVLAIFISIVGANITYLLGRLIRKKIISSSCRITLTDSQSSGNDDEEK